MRKNNIAVYISDEYFANRMVKILNENNVSVEKLVIPKHKREVISYIVKLLDPRIKVVHYIYGGYNPVVYIIPKLLGKKVIIHWVGTDVLSANRKGIYGFFQKIAYKIADRHLTDFELLARELSLIGIKAQVVQLIPNLQIPKSDYWPKENSVYIYLPEWRHKFYGSDIIFRLIEEMPHINFLITAHSGKDAPNLPNVKYFGYIDNLDFAIWKNVKVYLRLTKHDGLSHSVIEALSNKKYVIWSFEYPHCFKANTLEEVKTCLNKIFNIDKPNFEGFNYVKQEFNLQKLVTCLKGVYFDLIK